MIKIFERAKKILTMLYIYLLSVHDVNLNIDQVQEYVHFCNKMWNAAKYTLKSLGEDFTPQPLEEVSSGCTNIKI